VLKSIPINRKRPCEDGAGVNCNKHGVGLHPLNGHYDDGDSWLSRQPMPNYHHGHPFRLLLRHHCRESRKQPLDRPWLRSVSLIVGELNCLQQEDEGANGVVNGGDQLYSWRVDLSWSYKLDSCWYNLVAICCWLMYAKSIG